MTRRRSPGTMPNSAISISSSAGWMPPTASIDGRPLRSRGIHTPWRGESGSRRRLDATTTRWPWHGRCSSRPAAPEIAAQVGDLHAALGDATAAARYYDEAERLERDGWALEEPQPAALARLLGDRDRRADEAVALAEQAIAHRRDIFSEDALAWARFRAGRVEEASVASARALRTGTRDRRILYHAAAIKHAAGRRRRRAGVAGPRAGRPPDVRSGQRAGSPRAAGRSRFLTHGQLRGLAFPATSCGVPSIGAWGMRLPVPPPLWSKSTLILTPGVLTAPGGFTIGPLITSVSISFEALAGPPPWKVDDPFAVAIGQKVGVVRVVPNHDRVGAIGEGLCLKPGA